MRKDRSMLDWMGTYYKLQSNKFIAALPFFPSRNALTIPYSGRGKAAFEKTWHDTPLIAAQIEEDGTYSFTFNSTMRERRGRRIETSYSAFPSPE